MNPFLEPHWNTAHTRLVGYLSDALDEHLPDDLRSLPEEQLVIADDNAGKEYIYRADVAVVEKMETWRLGLAPSWQPDTNGGNLAVAEPEILVMTDDMDRWIEIRDKSGQIITVIEVLSPSNKGKAALTYMDKIRSYRQASINVVEIDLLRGGRHVLAVDAEHLKPTLGTRHLVCVSRAAIPWQREIYYCPLREPLPVIRVPLRRTDRDVAVALQPLVDRCYRMGRYWLEDYRENPQPPFSPEESGWINERLGTAGLRDKPPEN